MPGLNRLATWTTPGIVKPDGTTLTVDTKGTLSLVPTSTTSEFVDREIPSGALNGENTVFTLASVPTPSTSLHLYWNGLRMSSVDYTLSGQTLTLSRAPLSTDSLSVSYRLIADAQFVDGEIPNGAIDGTNVVFTLANSPSPASSLKLFWNGLKLRNNLDYTAVGPVITLVVPPGAGHNLTADYRL